MIQLKNTMNQNIVLNNETKQQMKQAQTYFDQGDIVQAETIIRSVIAELTDYMFPYAWCKLIYNIGKILQDSDILNFAYHKLLQHTPNKVSLWLRLAMLEEKRKNWQAANHAYLQASRLQSHSKIYSRLAISYQRLKDHKKAQRYFEQALACFNLEADANPSVAFYLEWATALAYCGYHHDALLKIMSFASEKLAANKAFKNLIRMITLQAAKQDFLPDALNTLQHLRRYPHTAAFFTDL